MQAPLERSEHQVPQYNYPPAPKQEEQVLPENVMYYAPVKYEVPQKQAAPLMNHDYPEQECILEEVQAEDKALKETWQMDSFQFLSLDRQKRKQ